MITFETAAPYNEFCDRAALDLMAFRRVSPRAPASDPEMDTVWRIWAGNRREAMMRDPNTTRRFLAATEPMLRLCAASLVVDYWPPNEAFAGPILRLALDDSESQIRGAAFAALLYKLHPWIHDPSGTFGKLLRYLSANDPVELEMARAVKQQANDMVKRAFDQVAALISELAGDDATAMKTSASAAEAYLKHPRPALRRAALIVLDQYFRAEVDIRAVCKRCVRTDNDIEVRLEAQSSLSVAFARSNDEDVGRFLASIVRDEREPARLRKDAYVSLLIVRPMPVTRVLHASSADFFFPNDVDWEFVRSFIE